MKNGDKEGRRMDGGEKVVDGEGGAKEGRRKKGRRKEGRGSGEGQSII